MAEDVRKQLAANVETLRNSGDLHTGDRGEGGTEADRLGGGGQREDVDWHRGVDRSEALLGGGLEIGDCDPGLAFDGDEGGSSLVVGGGEVGRDEAQHVGGLVGD